MGSRTERPWRPSFKGLPGRAACPGFGSWGWGVGFPGLVPPFLSERKTPCAPLFSKWFQTPFESPIVFVTPRKSQLPYKSLFQPPPPAF